MLAAVAALSSLSLTTLGTPSASAAPTGTLTTVATGLDNPRGLALGPNGNLFVGEAGHAGPVCIGSGETGPLCLGMTSQISAIRLSSGRHVTVVNGLPSVGTAVASTGVDGIAYGNGSLYGIVTGSRRAVPPNPCAGARDVRACRALVAAVKTRLGDLIRVRNGVARSVAEVGTYDYDWIVAHKAYLDRANPDFQPGDANPYGVALGPQGVFVVDAGSNTLDYVDRSGRVAVVRDASNRPVYLPNPPGDPRQRFPYDAVPTCVAVSHHVVWMGTLSGQVWKLAGRRLSLVADRSDGLTAINGCALDSQDHLWVSNIFGATPQTAFAPNTGSIMVVSGSGIVRTIARGVNFPAGIAIAPDRPGHRGNVYVAVNSVCPKSLRLITRNDPPICQATGAVVRVSR